MFTADEVFSLLDMESAISACKEALAMHHAGEVNVPLRLNLPVEEFNGQVLYMPAVAPKIGAAGIKVLGVYPDNTVVDKPVIHAQVILQDAKTGETSAIIEGASLTQVRTGAVQGAATDLLANQNAAVGALIGTGGQAAAQLEAMLSVRNLSEIKIYGRNQEKAQDFARAQQQRFPEVKIHAVTSPREAVSDADIVTAVTSAPNAVFEAQDLKPGAHVNGIGSYTPQTAELPIELFEVASKVFVDTQDCLAEAGDIINPINQGVLKPESCQDLGALIRDLVPGRESPDEITVFNSVGSAILDIVCADRLYKIASQN